METISFARGVPAPECLPVEELGACAQAAVARDGATVLSYGSSSGYAPLRDWIAERHGVDPARVLITNGSLQGMVFLAERFAGERVLVEEPTYDRPLKILAAHGIETTPIAMDDEGLDLDALAQTLRSGRKPAFLYTIPTFQNPSGRTLSTERRHRLAELAREQQLLVLEDDPYGLVRFDGEAPPTLFELEGGTHVAYSSSFSKTIAPGLRVGYFVLPAGLEQELEALATSTYITPVLIGQATVFEFLRRGNFEPNRCSKRWRASFRTRVGAGRRAATSSGSSCPKAPMPARCSSVRLRQVSRSFPARTSAAHQTRRGLRSASSPRTRSEKACAGSQPSSGSRSPFSALGGRDLGEVAERPRYEPRLAGWNERPPAVEPEGGAGCVGRKGTEPGATEVAVVARQLIRLAQFSPLPRDLGPQ